MTGTLYEPRAYPHGSIDPYTLPAANSIAERSKSVDELDEMITILEGIQKHRREIYLLTQRARTMCPTLMHWEHNWQNERVRQLLDHEVLGNQYEVNKKVAEQIQEYRGRKAIVQRAEEQEG